MSSSRSARPHHGSRHGSSSGKKSKASQSTRQLIESLQTHRVNTLTELCRIERHAASCDSEEDARAFQGPMTAAWAYYVSSNQMLSELRGLTPNYPFCGDILTHAQGLVRNDPESNRSWNLAWLCLVKITDDDLIASFAGSEASRPEMWGGRQPSAEEAQQLAACFQYEWESAVQNMLRHWQATPTWY
ncbi:hypothetical protein QBC34DRAFT_211689 [Podospora aff. communis PSN243]|uniref:Uncharacterized protein n=1 Tax=Podospora aff. communis PSN243 TaxID=3040156 RepID=A0AAV9G7G5_9PEZI|nr:hypothetical protein QBC34DRAFT_211689 [Podospora aff. communis PSN243]